MRPPPPWVVQASALAALASGFALRSHPAEAAALAAGAAAGAWYGARRWRPAGALAAAAALAALAALAAAGWHGSRAPPPPTVALGSEVRLRGTLADDPRQGLLGPRVSVDLEATAHPVTGDWEPATGRVLLHLTGQPAPLPGRGAATVFRAALRAPGGFRNPGRGGQAASLARAGIGARASAAWPGEAAFAEPGPGTPAWLRWRRATALALDRAVPGQPGAVLRALALGDRSGLSPETQESFRRAGTAHLVAISGLHLGLLALLTAPALRLALARWTRLALAHPVEPLARALTFPLLAAYAALSGFQTSTLRALAMTALWLVGAAALGRPTSPATLLLGTALALAAPWPAVLGDPGFHLSLAALGGLFWLAPALERRFGPTPDPLDRLGPPPPLAVALARRAARAARSTVWVSVAATLTTAPLSVFHFGAGSLLGLGVNPVAVPLVGFLCLPLALLGVVLHGVWPGGAEGLWRGAGLGVQALLGLQEAVSGWVSPWSWAPLRAVPGLAGALVLLAWLCRRLDGRRGRALLAAGLGLIAAGPTARWVRDRVDDRVHLWVLDVGQGQAL
ncbi:MAG: ComEC/Rec2 family competence protein, partial [Deferrisomatales bacterium]